jgi:hypothetical protein
MRAFARDDGLWDVEAQLARRNATPVYRRTAKALGIELPASLLLRADRVFD